MKTAYIIFAFIIMLFIIGFLIAFIQELWRERQRTKKLQSSIRKQQAELR